MGHWDLVRWKQKKSFPPHPPTSPGPAFCIFSLFITYLLTLATTSSEDGKRNTADQVFTSDLQRDMHMKECTIERIPPLDPTLKCKAGRLEKHCPFPVHKSMQKGKLLHTENCSRANQRDQY